jgi:outer membrane lipoprotein
MSRLIVIGFAIVLGGCLHPPKPLSGEFPQTTVADVQGDTHQGERVRWGGMLIVTKPGKTTTCFEVMALPLSRQARPRRSDVTTGRFIACAPGFYDPAVYSPQREITIVGAIDGAVSGKVGDYQYTYPRVAADVVYVWPERPPSDDGYYYGGGPYWSPYWGPYYPPPYRP